MLLGTYVASFGFFILREFHLKKEELIGQKLILILQSITLLFSKNSSTIIYLVYFSLTYAKKMKNNFRLLFYLFLLFLNLILISSDFI
jgi:hypothetical protein